MTDKNRERRGNSLENEISDMFKKIGFETDIRSKKFGFESDVIATRGNFIILIQAKRYDETQIDINSLIDEWKYKGEKVGADRVLIVITGYKNLNEDYIKKAKQKGVYLWNEKYWRKLQILDMIDVYSEIGINLEIEDILSSQKKKDENDLKELYAKLDCILNPQIKKRIYEDLEKINFSDETKRRIQIKKVENEILFAKEKEIEDKSKDKIDDIELEELSRLVNKSSLDFDKRYQILNEIDNNLDLSPKSKRIINVEKIKERIKKLEEDSDTENWGDEQYLKIEKLFIEGKISQKDREYLQEQIKNLGLSKKGFTDAKKIELENLLNRSKFKKIILKLFIRVGLLIIVFLIIWMVLF